MKIYLDVVSRFSLFQKRFMLMFMLLSGNELFAQHVNMYFHHCELVAANEIQFDVSLQNDSNDTLGFNSIVVRFNHSPNIATTSDFSWEYIPGSTTLMGSNFPGLATYKYISSTRVFTTSSQTSVYDKATAPILPKDSMVKIGRYRIWLNTGVFNQGASLGLNWDQSAGCVLYVNGSATVTSFNTAQKITLVTPCPLVIPEPGVSPISDFSGKIEETYDVLTWITATEKDNAYFNLYQSTDGTNYQFISKVITKAANGNSSTPLNYGYVNNYPVMGKNYYKLEQVSKDNSTVTHNKIVILERKAANGKYQIYPNPVIDVLTLAINADKAKTYQIRILDMAGRSVKEVEAYGEAGMNKVQLDIEGYATGLYTLQLFEDEVKVYVERINKIN